MSNEEIWPPENKGLKDKVEDVLKRKEQARNSDKFLLWYFYRYEEDANLNKFEEFKDLPASESITRARREIQYDKGLYLPTKEEVISQRRVNEEKIREYYSEEKQEEIFTDDE